MRNRMMRNRKSPKKTAIIVLGLALGAATSLRAAEAPSAELALKFRPVQTHIEYDTPKKSEYSKCVVKVERAGETSGWIVLGPQSQVLRRFIDTNNDNVVDQWRYFHNGFEVYRDIDTDFNNKVDQSRWVNTAGTRWGIDDDEDGRIDSWKVISAQEACQVAFHALIEGNEQAFKTVCVSQDDIRSLGIRPKYSKKLLASVASLSTKMQSVVSGSKMLSRETKWMRFDASSPSMVPADAGKATSDLTVYENAMAIVEFSGESKLLQFGEMIRVGDTWKLTMLPQPLDRDGETIEVAVGGILMQPSYAGDAETPAANNMSPEMQKVLTELQELDGKSPSPSAGAKALATYNAKRADLLTRLMNMAKTDAEKDQWLRQLIDGIATTIQTGAYPEGLNRLTKIEENIRRKNPKSPTYSYAVYRRLLAQFSVDLQKADDAGRLKVREDWLKAIEKFVATYPEADDTPDAILQLAVSEEFDGDIKNARKWYSELVKNHADNESARRASGAMRRLDLKGKPLDFSASTLEGGTIDSGRFRGKVLLVLFWSTWCKPCTEDLPQIREFYKQYRNQGFEILGINLDTTSEPVAAYMKEHNIVWPQAHEPGGLESSPALSYGIISLPTMFLVGKDGKVVSRSVSVEDLKKKLPGLLSAK